MPLDLQQQQQQQQLGTGESTAGATSSISTSSPSSSSSSSSSSSKIFSKPKSDEKDKEKNDEKSTSDALAIASYIKEWLGKIKKSKKKFQKDFQRMRDNMKFAGGIQWPGQKTIDDRKYIANVALREVQAKTAQLYARNPTAEYTRRKRKDYLLYDGKLENIIPLIQKAGIGMPLNPSEMALIADFAHGQQAEEQMKHVGETLEILFQYALDEQDIESGDAKVQLKQCVRQAIVTGVAFCRVSFVRDIEHHFTSNGMSDTFLNKATMARSYLEKVEEGDIQQDDKRQEQLKALLNTLAVTVGNEDGALAERLVFDFLPSTSVIIDPCCKNLKGFIGAQWIAVEYHLSIKDVNDMFETDIKEGNLKKTMSTSEEYGKKDTVESGDLSSQPKDKDNAKCWLYEILNRRDGSHFYIVDGYDKYCLAPESLEPSVRGFWPLAVLTFNDIVTEESNQELTIYPPSDIQLLKHAQKEINRMREELRKHRKANSPGWITRKGYLTSDDKERLEQAPTNAVTELEGVPENMALEKVFIPRPQVPIEPLVYDTTTSNQDIVATTGQQVEQVPQKQKGGTATAAQLNAQETMSVTASNVDDLDDFLSLIARISGEMQLKEMNPDTVKRIVGIGAVWPMQDKQDFLDQIILKTRAASSGRPNQVQDLKNWQIVAPVLQAAGANPQFMVRETLRRLNDNMDPEEAFPLVPPQGMFGGGAGTVQHPQGGEHQPSDQEQHQPGLTTPPQQNRPGPGPGQIKK